MNSKNQPETLEVQVDEQNRHGDVDGTVACEGGARSSSRQSNIHSDKKSKPIDEAVKDKVKDLLGQ